MFRNALRDTPSSFNTAAVLHGEGASDSMPIVAGVIAAVVGAVLIATAFFLRRRWRRPSKPKITDTDSPSVSSTRDHDDLEQGREQRPDTHRHTSALQTPEGVDAVSGACIVSPSAPVSLHGQAQSSVEHAKNGFRRGNRGAGLVGKDAAAIAPLVTASTATMSIYEGTDLLPGRRRQRAADAASVSGGPKPDEASGGGIGGSSAADRQNSAREIGLGRAVLAAAQELAHHCQVPGVSEAAAAVCLMANLVTDSHDNDRANESRLRQCRAIVMALKRAAKVAEKVS